MSEFNTLFLLSGLLLFFSVMASTLSVRLGLPLLLLFLAVGMLAGEEGPGGVLFDDFVLANTVGQLALAVILLDGGLRTRVDTFRVALRPAALLATWGVIATSGLLGLFAAVLLDVDWRYALLLASIVGSTDAASVFSLLRESGVRINERVRSTLEIESGANDPMAILMVTVLVSLLLRPDHTSAGDVALTLLQQGGLGLSFGIAGGWVLSRLLIRLTLADGLYSLLIVSGGLIVFATSNLVGGSGFLAIYVAGILAGRQPTHSTEHVLRVMDGLAWLAQAGMFVMLGLLVTPSHVLEYGWEALAVALFLMFVARPLAVLFGLLPFRFAPNEIAFVGWVGLRGAVPIILAIFPVVMGVPDSRLLFDVTFAVVILSLLVQGATIPWVARRLRVVLPAIDEPSDRRIVWLSENASLCLFEYRVVFGAGVEGLHPGKIPEDLGSPAIPCLGVVRSDVLLPVDDDLRLREGDAVWYLVSEPRSLELARIIGVSGEDVREQAGFFGELPLNPGCLAGDLNGLYGLELTSEESAMTLRDLVSARLMRPPVAGDRVVAGRISLIVRSVDGQGTITEIGLKLPQEGKALSS
jgi:potassium/hydrogen antiporter